MQNKKQNQKPKTKTPQTLKFKNPASRKLQKLKDWRKIGIKYFQHLRQSSYKSVRRGIKKIKGMEKWFTKKRKQMCLLLWRDESLIHNERDANEQMSTPVHHFFPNQINKDKSCDYSLVGEGVGERACLCNFHSSINGYQPLWFGSIYQNMYRYLNLAGNGGKTGLLKWMHLKFHEK